MTTQDKLRFHGSFEEDFATGGIAFPERESLTDFGQQAVHPADDLCFYQERIQAGAVGDRPRIVWYQGMLQWKSTTP